MKSYLLFTCFMFLPFVGVGILDAAQHREYVAFGDSITKGLGDDDLSNGEGYPDHLSKLLQTPGNIVKNAGDPGDLSQHGLNKIRDLLERYPLATHFLIMFGTNDVRSSTAPEIFRSNMRGIIRAIEQAGKVPLLARIPPNYYNTHQTRPFGPPCDMSLPSAHNITQRTVAFNKIIDELVSEYNLEIDPGRPLVAPDFYNYFKSTGIDGEGKSPEFSDCVHPNDVGYQSMAKLWREALEGGPINLQEPEPLKEIYVYKSDTERVTSNNEFQPDDHLVFNVGENERWTFEALLWVKTTNAEGDFRFLWRGPKGSDVRANVVAYQENTIIEQANQLGMNVFCSVDYTKAVTVEPVYLKGVFSTGSTGGRIRLEWAQITGLGTTSVYFPSYLEARRVSTLIYKQILPAVPMLPTDRNGN